MNNDQITALAREYAEEQGKGDRELGFPEFFIKDMLEFNEKEMKSALDFLLRRYCLVEKKQVFEVYKSAKHNSKMAHRERLYTMLAVTSARKALLESLFPEIAKEVEV